jgi:hypothetical protein
MGRLTAAPHRLTWDRHVTQRHDRGHVPVRRVRIGDGSKHEAQDGAGHVARPSGIEQREVAAATLVVGYLGKVDWHVRGLSLLSGDALLPLREQPLPTRRLTITRRLSTRQFPRGQMELPKWHSPEGFCGATATAAI